jgi:hypothetical protein
MLTIESKHTTIKWTPRRWVEVSNVETQEVDSELRLISFDLFDYSYSFNRNEAVIIHAALNQILKQYGLIHDVELAENPKSTIVADMVDAESVSISGFSQLKNKVRVKTNPILTDPVSIPPKKRGKK